MRFKIDWASHIVGRKFTVSALFYFVFEGNFPSTSPRVNIWRGDLTEGFALPVWGLIFGGAYFGILRYLLAASLHLLLRVLFSLQILIYTYQHPALLRGRLSKYLTVSTYR